MCTGQFTANASFRKSWRNLPEPLHDAVRKTKDYFDNGFNVGVYTNDAVRANLAVDLHWREHDRFRQALLNPDCTFYDLLKISIESRR